MSDPAGDVARLLPSGTGPKSVSNAVELIEALQKLGYVIVPRIPTREMLIAGDVVLDYPPIGDALPEIWGAMVEAGVR